ncbi:hypothetical protein WMY93_033426 [Mugilogobius chulae]|uniref:Uncharacterized protein n=1 Tax=Mugilogobius chulae TaxID=88201 RepID=A0AAW0MNV8_9GOBI
MFFRLTGGGSSALSVISLPEIKEEEEGNRRRVVSQDGKSREMIKTLLSETTPGRKRCTGSGSEWEEGVGIYSEEEEGGAAGSMNGWKSVAAGGKRGQSPVKVGQGKKVRMTARDGEREVEMGEEREFKVIVRFGEGNVMRREVRVQQVRVQNKLSYAEAVQVAKQGQQEVRRTQMVLEPPESSSREFVKRLITFVAGVINATKEIKSKTERIQVIVKAAVSHLKIDDLCWEEVRDELEAEGDRRGGGG